jgi:hypothetical protein
MSNTKKPTEGPARLRNQFTSRARSQSPDQEPTRTKEPTHVRHRSPRGSNYQPLREQRSCRQNLTPSRCGLGQEGVDIPGAGDLAWDDFVNGFHATS